MRRVLTRWQRSGLTLQKFGQQRGIPLSTLAWWWQVFRRAAERASTASKSGAAGAAALFTEVPRPTTSPATPAALEIVLRNGDMLLVRVGADTETLRGVLQAARRQLFLAVSDN